MCLLILINVVSLQILFAEVLSSSISMVIPIDETKIQDQSIISNYVNLCYATSNDVSFAVDNRIQTQEGIDRSTKQEQNHI